jgi:hypothetical protein
VAARKAPLHVVKSGDKPPARKRTNRAKSVSRAASGGDRRELLVAMRARIAKAVEDPTTPARDLAALSRRLLEIAREIEALDVAADQEAAENAEVDDEAFDAEAL